MCPALKAEIYAINSAAAVGLMCETLQCVLTAHTRKPGTYQPRPGVLSTCGGAREYSLEDDNAMHGHGQRVPPHTFPDVRISRPALYSSTMFIIVPMKYHHQQRRRQQQQREATGYSRTTAMCRPPRTPPRGRSSSRPRASGTPPWGTRTAKRCSASFSIVSWTPFRTVREAATPQPP